MIWLKILSVVLSAIFLIADQKNKQKGKYGIFFWLAILFAGVAITTIIVEHFTEKVANLERKADLEYIQMLNMPVHSICFEL